MPGCWSERRSRAALLQGGARGAAALAACCLLAACTHPLSGPIDLFHDLEGGEIAENRPPPPGIGQPYPKLGTVPAKPVMPDPAYRKALQAQLVSERDRTERVAADNPIQAVPPPPPPPATAATSPEADPAKANAMLDTAEAPPPPPVAVPPPLPVASRASAPAVAPATAIPAVAPSLPPETPIAGPVTIAGAPAGSAGLPEIPPAPPPPATFEGVAAEPSPTPSLLPTRLPAPAAGTPIFFPTASAVLPVSQTQALKDFVSHRGHAGVEIIGLGETASDTPDGQATAVALGLARARAVAEALAGMHVPQAAMRVGADAFGRGAVLRLLP